jgi:hypothetical protein
VNRAKSGAVTAHMRVGKSHCTRGFWESLWSVGTVHRRTKQAKQVSSALLRCTEVSPPTVELRHGLPRRFVAVAAATLHKADPPAGGCGALRHRSQR